MTAPTTKGEHMNMMQAVAYMAAMVLCLGGAAMVGIAILAVIGWLQYRLDGGRQSLRAYLRGL